MRRYKAEWLRMTGTEQATVATMFFLIDAVLVTIGVSGGDVSRSTLALEESFFAFVLVILCAWVVWLVRIVARLRQEIAREHDESWPEH